MIEAEKYKNKYRVPSARWATWDYGANAAYFVTICTKNRSHYFGTIHERKMAFTPTGRSAQKCWLAIPAHFPFVILDESTVMPNHVHGIILINKPPVETQDFASSDDETQDFETQDFASLPRNKFGPQSKNLASIIRGYKIGVTKFANKNNIKFAWQPRYHDHVIRNDEELERIRHYIRTNPETWADDTYY